MGAADIAGPYACDKAIDTVIRFGDKVFFRAERDCGQHRTEDLFLRDAHLRIDIGEHRRLNEVTPAQAFGSLAARDEAPARFVTHAAVTQYPFPRSLHPPRPHLRHP